MKERPILFSGPMVRAILEGRKTQTRRVVKLPANAKHVQYWTPPSGKSEHGWADPGVNYWTPDPSGETESNHLDRCPYGQPGDRLWVRETWTCVHGVPSAGGVPHPDDFVRYRADAGPSEKLIDDIKCWHPSIHMPRVYSRISLEITAVRVERLNDINRGDAMSEGCPFPNMASGADPRKWYVDLWEQINGQDSWLNNPWVWVIEFRMVTS